jgi:hypothetical protein
MSSIGRNFDHTLVSIYLLLAQFLVSGPLMTSDLGTPLRHVGKGDSQCGVAIIQGWKLGASHGPRPDR